MRPLKYSLFSLRSLRSLRLNLPTPITSIFNRKERKDRKAPKLKTLFMNGSLAPFWIDRTSRLPVDPVEAEHAFVTEIEIVGQDVAPWKACDLEQFFGADRSDAARMAAADVTEREWSLAANGRK